MHQGRRGASEVRQGEGDVGGTLKGGRVIQMFCQCIATCQECTNCFNNWLFCCWKCMNDFLRSQRAAFWLKLHPHHQCISTDQATAAQEETTLPLHTLIRYMWVCIERPQIAEHTWVDIACKHHVDSVGIVKTINMNLDIKSKFLFLFSILLNHIISTCIFGNVIWKYLSTDNIQNLFLSSNM